MRTRLSRTPSRVRRAAPYRAGSPWPQAALLLFISVLFLPMYYAKLVESTLPRGPSMLILDPAAYQAFMENAQPMGGFITSLNPTIPFFPMIFVFALFVASAPRAEAHPHYPRKMHPDKAGRRQIK